MVFSTDPSTGWTRTLCSGRRYKLAHQAIYHDADCASHIILPVQNA